MKDPEKVAAMKRDYREAGLSEADLAMLDYVRIFAEPVGVDFHLLVPTLRVATRARKLGERVRRIGRRQRGGGKGEPECQSSKPEAAGGFPVSVLEARFTLVGVA